MGLGLGDIGGVVTLAVVLVMVMDVGEDKDLWRDFFTGLLGSKVATRLEVG